MDISTAWAVVHASDNSMHRVCWTPDDMVDAINELVAAGKTPLPFTASAANSAPQVVNNATGPVTGKLTQAHTINNGVRL